MQLHRRFIEQAQKNPNKIAVTDYGLNRNYTYKQILLSAILLSKQISGLTSDRYIGLMIPVSGAHIIAKLAILMAGKTPALINHSTGALKNCDYARKKCGTRLFLTSKLLLEKLNVPATEDMIFIEEILPSMKQFEQQSALFNERDVEQMVHSGSDEEEAVVLFTSGSEKDPKVVPLTHTNIGSNVDSVLETMNLKSDDTYIGVLPFFHVFGMTTCLWAPMISGATLVAHANPLNVATVVSSVKEHQVTVFFATPAFFYAYAPKAKREDFASLKIIIAGGDSTPRDLYDLYREKFNKIIGGGYGATELSPVTCMNPPGKDKVGSIGPVLKGIEIKIISIETGEELGPMQEGRLLVKGPNVMKGYLNDPERTAEVLKNGWYDTGDIAYIDEEGYVFHRGRYRRFIKVAGEMFSLVSIEEKVRKYIPKESNCCVVARRHPTKGAEVAVAFDKELDFDELRSKLAKELTPLMLPRHCLVIETIPLLGSGKVNFKEVERIVNEDTIN